MPLRSVEVGLRWLITTTTTPLNLYLAAGSFCFINQPFHLSRLACSRSMRRSLGFPYCGDLHTRITPTSSISHCLRKATTTLFRVLVLGVLGQARKHVKWSQYSNQAGRRPAFQCRLRVGGC